MHSAPGRDEAPAGTVASNPGSAGTGIQRGAAVGIAAAEAC